MNITNLFICLSDEEKQTLRTLLEIEESQNNQSPQPKQTLADFIRDKKPSERLRRILEANYDMLVPIDSFKRHDLLRLRNFGNRTMIEFIELRGF